MYIRLKSRQHGLTMIELMVTVIVLLVGLMGLAGLQSRLQQSEIESYQRAQALILLNDMSSRLAANRQDASSYVTSSPLGSGITCGTETTPRSTADLNSWCRALQGAAEKLDASDVGAVIGGRGCIAELPSNSVHDAYMITVAWQGLVGLGAPEATTPCGAGSFNDAGACSGDRCRRVVTTIVRVADLEVPVP
jgi:type IV pilus assembly protein PilV